MLNDILCGEQLELPECFKGLMYIPRQSITGNLYLVHCLRSSAVRLQVQAPGRVKLGLKASPNVVLYIALPCRYPFSQRRSSLLTAQNSTRTIKTLNLEPPAVSQQVVSFSAHGISTVLSLFQSPSLSPRPVWMATYLNH